MSTAGARTDVGAMNASVGVFTMLLEDISPTLAPSGYPEEWLEVELTVTDLAAPTTGRVAFRYFTQDGGPAGDNSNYIGIDEVSVEQAIAGQGLAANPTTLSFGSLTTGTTSGSETVTLTNTGDATTTIAAITVSGDGFTLYQTGTVTVTVTSDAAGSTTTIALTGTGAAPSTGTTYPSADTPLDIPDEGPAGIVSTITVPNSTLQTGDVNVDLDVTHTYVGDLTMTLAHSGVTETIFDQPGVPEGPFGCSGNDVDLTIDDDATGSIEADCVSGANPAQSYGEDGSYAPDGGDLAAFEGTPSQGAWTLTISDAAGGDTGTLNAWALVISGPVAGETGTAATVSRLVVAPNPLAGQGQIDLTVATAQDVRVVLFDALGREVRVLLDRAMAAGQQAYIGFTTTDLPAGVYVVRASGTDVSLTQRVTVVR